ncbi:MAG: Smr/MutS family protein [Thermomonas hydrothermalis]|uniref:Smr/MutS family protein n=1 Tax=Thermomonas hydrothermalis TaxID=213588 RepID=UPI0023545AF7|nr:Smr/MutS family protein [Thermomonas hydrothermalis]MCL6618846.1 Smr/MutS family protein [Thermomonas hydrothermalis]
MRKAPPDATPPEASPADDAALFRAAIGADRGKVRVLPPAPPPPAPPRPRPAARMARRDEDEARAEFRQVLTRALDAGDPLSYRRDDIAPRILKKLARGDYAAQEELDLHGLPVQTAEALLRQFLRDCRSHRLYCVRIIHGKGRHSEDRLPVLKNLVDRLLRQRADVLAFHSPPPAQGGTGAVLVLLDTR